MSSLFCEDQEIGHFSMDISQKLIENLTSPTKLKNEEFGESPVFSKPFILMKSHSEIAYKSNCFDSFTQEFRSFNKFSFWDIEDENVYKSNRFEGLTLIYENFVESRLDCIYETQMFYAENFEICNVEVKIGYIHSKKNKSEANLNKVGEKIENCCFNQEIIEILEEILTKSGMKRSKKSRKS